MGQRIGLWRFGDIGGGKYLVERLDGSVLDHPNMVLGARDPCAPAALRAYAARAEELEFIGYPSATAPGRRPTIASYHITRRDGTRPDWPGAVMSAADPCAPAALRAYARACRAVAPAGGDTSMQGGYADDVERLAEEFDPCLSGWLVRQRSAVSATTVPDQPVGIRGGAITRRGNRQAPRNLAARSYDNAASQKLPSYVKRNHGQSWRQFPVTSHRSSQRRLSVS